MAVSHRVNEEVVVASTLNRWRRGGKEDRVRVADGRWQQHGRGADGVAGSVAASGRQSVVYERPAMEEELRCPACKQLFCNPVLLPCYHALCLNCAVHLQQPASLGGGGVAAGGVAAAGPVVAVGQAPPSSSASTASSSGGTAAGDEAGAAAGCDYQEVDKLSILSETDSGVVCTSRPNSYVGTPNLLSAGGAPCVLTLSCPAPACRKPVYFDEGGAHNLPKYRAMQAIVDKVLETRHVAARCQLCETEPAAPAAVLCEQCEVLYCEQCRDACHPARGPLARHTLLEPAAGRAALRARHRARDALCAHHDDEPLSLYCLVCKAAVCASCVHDSRHASHDVQPINTMCKAQKRDCVCTLRLRRLQQQQQQRVAPEAVTRWRVLADPLLLRRDRRHHSGHNAAGAAQVITVLWDRPFVSAAFVLPARGTDLRAMPTQKGDCGRGELLQGPRPWILQSGRSAELL
ncbi:E3 ubiquitin-protein ligase TRIM9-like [Schistocerca serialis cubense]|uniref:E3 ubiquitin-protein ligase TRIM9-like n=1 Tax=Schistocerca serialis cubense TaxID=2023355 RepID=UPI00214F3830|nr:E3 ubiquitin-protein ligase TRIM9-like [Schistocerca serialis cubense]